MSNQVETKIYAALLARLSLAVADAVVAWIRPGEKFPSAQSLPDEFLLTQILCASSRLHIGSGESRPYRGDMVLSLVQPEGTWLADASERAGKIASWFPEDHKMVFEGVSVRVRSKPQIASGYRDSDLAKWRTPIIIPFESYS